MAIAERIPAPASALTHTEKNFRPSVVEKDLYDWWERSGFFRPPDEDDGRPKFVMMLPLPNVTGDLHLGHALGFGGYEDLMARWHRMKGDATLWMPGTDHAGIIAQIVVEKELAKAGMTKERGLTRDEFLAEMWKWMDFYRPRIEQQLRLLGCSLDWSRPNFTMEPSKQRAVRAHFIRLYKKGFLYREGRIVHWCLTCQTTYSDLEALHTERTDSLYYVRYPWAEAMPQGTPEVVVATTRPETILADVAVAVHPDDPRWKPLLGKDVLVPVVERRVKIIADEAVDPAFGTGALKITPGHDQTDFEIGQRHRLPVLTVIGKDGRMLPAAGPLAGLDRDRARVDMVDRLRKSGLLLKEEPLTHAVGIHDRCSTVDEPLVLPQWWVRMKPLAEPAIAAVREGRVRIIPEFQERIYFNWMENIRDWAVSRQIWWGHEIPAWFCRDCDEIVVPDEAAPDPTACPKCRSNDLRKDPDVLDTWFSSALWPFTTLGWPERTKDLARFYPGQMLETGYDILFFWVARMIVMGIFEMGDVPFSHVYLHGLVRTGGEKMSKSKGNVQSPVGLIDEYGADALRFALVLDTAAGMDTELSEAKLTNARNFGNKLWNIGRFVLRQLEAHPDALAGRAVDEHPTEGLGEAERWILSRTERAVAEATRLIEGHYFGEYAHFMQQFVWSELADAYVELSKAGLRDEARGAGTVRTLAYVLDRVLRLLHPLMPFISETLALQLWARAGTSKNEASLVKARWPETGPRDEALEERFGVALEIAKAGRALRQDAGLTLDRRISVTLSGEPRVSFNGSQIVARFATGPDKGVAGLRVDAGPERLIDLYALSPGELDVPSTQLPFGPHELEIRAASKNASSSDSHIQFEGAMVRARSGQIRLAPLRDVIATLTNGDVRVAIATGPSKSARTIDVRIEAERDLAVERARLERELADAREAVRRSEELLASPGFKQKAPAAVVQKEEARLGERRSQVALVLAGLSRLGRSGEGDFVVKAAAATALRVPRPQQFRLPSAEVVVTNFEARDAGGPFHRGLFFDVRLRAPTAEEAVQTARRHLEYLESVFALAMAVGITHSEAVAAFSPNQQGTTDVVQFEELPAFAAVRRHLDTDGFRNVWDALERVRPDWRERISRAIAWHRKAMFEEYALDRFTAAWNALEALNPILQEKHSLPTSGQPRPCPNCGEPITLPAISSGIRHALEAKGGADLWRLAHDARNGIVHGHEPLAGLSGRVRDASPDMLRVLRETVLDLLDLSAETRAALVHSPLEIPRPYKIRHELRISELPGIPLGAEFPRLQFENLHVTRREVGGRIEEEVRTDHRYVGPGRADVVSSAVQALIDPDDTAATLTALDPQHSPAPPEDEILSQE